MHVAIDITSILRNRHTDVGAYTHGLVRTLVQDTSIQWYLYYYHTEERKRALKEITNTLLTGDHVHVIECRIPRVIFYLLRLFGGALTIDEYIAKCSGIDTLDWLYMPEIVPVAISPRTRFVLGIHELCHGAQSGRHSFLKRLQQHVIRPRVYVDNARMIIVPSENVKQGVIKQYDIDENKIRIIVPGIPEAVIQLSDREWEVFATQHELEKQFFVTCTRVDKKYNIKSVVEAYERSGLYKRGISLVIIGQGKQKGIRIPQLFKKTLGVVCIEHITESEQNSLISRACAVLCTSWCDTIGLSLIHAYAHGVPAIISDREALPAMAGGASYVVRPHMISDIAYAMREFVFDPALRDWYGNAGKVRSGLFDWQKSVQNVLAIFKTHYYSSYD